ncbi:MAG TPA: hypothetical protein VGC26_10795, partial [Afipia sp.]
MKSKKTTSSELFWCVERKFSKTYWLADDAALIARGSTAFPRYIISVLMRTERGAALDVSLLSPITRPPCCTSQYLKFKAYEPIIGFDP